MFEVYLSHPFGGRQENKDDAALVEAGIKAVQTGEYEIVNPLRLLEEEADSFSEKFMTRWAAKILKQCALAVFCPGWEKSRGCRYENYVAKKHGIPRIYLDEEMADVFRKMAPAYQQEAVA